MINLTDGKEAVIEFHEAAKAVPDLCPAGARWFKRAVNNAAAFSDFLDKMITDDSFTKPSWITWTWENLNDILSEEIKLMLITSAASDKASATAVLNYYKDSPLLTTVERNILQNSIDNG